MVEPLRVLVVHGPNLNTLGTREPEVYGSLTIDDINDELGRVASGANAELEFFQSNHEGALIDRIQEARSWADGILINPAGLTHTSVALRDALVATELPVVEVHLSNVHTRETFRHHSYVTFAATGLICGLGVNGYALAVDAVVELLKDLQSVGKKST